MEVYQVQANLDQRRIADQNVAASVNSVLEPCFAAQRLRSTAPVGAKNMDVRALTIARVSVFFNECFIARLYVVFSSLLAINAHAPTLLQFLADKINDSLLFGIDGVFSKFLRCP